MLYCTVGRRVPSLWICGSQSPHLVEKWLTLCTDMRCEWLFVFLSFRFTSSSTRLVDPCIMGLWSPPPLTSVTGLTLRRYWAMASFWCRCPRPWCWIGESLTGWCHPRGGGGWWLSRSLVGRLLYFSCYICLWLVSSSFQGFCLVPACLIAWIFSPFCVRPPASYWIESF